MHKTKEIVINTGPLLAMIAGIGEASVIQYALDKNIQTVCIDEAMGRRIARLNGLSLTGSIGVLIRAKQEGFAFSMQEAINRMQSHGIYLSQKVMARQNIEALSVYEGFGCKKYRSSSRSIPEHPAI